MKVPVQPTTNIGVVGHVDHGKTQLVYRLTGEHTDRHSEEIKRGISIRLGYADAAFYKCTKCDTYGIHEACGACGGKAELSRAVSFVDSPGHETLMATMLSGAALMDGALLVVAANEPCPQPQTKEHLMALDIIGVKDIVVVQNKIDLVDEKGAEDHYEQIRTFVEGTVAEGAPVIPVSAHHDVNIDTLISTIEETIPTRAFEEGKDARMFVARSFDVNQPGIGPDKLVGGVIGGSILQGHIAVGDEVEVVPGRQVGGGTGGKVQWEPLVSEITSLYAGGKPRKEGRPGGLIAIGTKLDPYFTKSDSLVGRVAGVPDTLPPILSKMTVRVHLLDRVVGMQEDVKVDAIKTNEPLMLSVGTATTVGVVTSAREDEAEMALKIPVAAEGGQRVAVSRRIAGKWRLIGYGIIQ
jgi:translation initiation factor 2 subunit 3